MNQKGQPKVYKQDGFLYSILNVHPAASQVEITERYRALSLIFHPDKQRDDSLRETATEKFYEVQKAYQVLSDPFLRQVYDALGEDGLAVKWPEEIRSKTQEEIHAILYQANLEVTLAKLKKSILPQGKVACSVNVASIFSGRHDGDQADSAGNGTGLINRIKKIEIFSTFLSHSAEKRLNDKTSLVVEARAESSGQRGGMFDITGTIKHQFSPRLESALSLSFFFPYITKLNATYQDNDTTMTMKSVIAPGALQLLPLTSTISITRKLFRESFTRGKLSMKVGRQPQLGFFLVSPSPFDLSNTDSDDIDAAASAPSISGFNLGVTHKSCGILFTSGLPKFVVEFGATFKELASRVTLGFEYGLDGLHLVLTTLWSNKTSEISAMTALTPTTVMLTLEFAYLEQRLSMPIILSMENDPFVALCTAVIPSTTMLLGYHFIIRPRRRARRLAYIRAARKAFEEDSDIQREKNAVEGLLKDTARRHMDAETAKEGLLILEASYGAAETEEGVQDMLIDVTIPIQALVRNSQLYIRGGKDRSRLQGFADPAPYTFKALRVRYLFRGHMHYAEIPDCLPAVLPLAEHRVDGCS